MVLIVDLSNFWVVLIAELYCLLFVQYVTEVNAFL